MADIYVPMTAESILPCSKEDFKELEDKFGDTMNAIGILTEFSDKEEYRIPPGLYFYSEFGVDHERWEDAEDFRKFLGSLVKKAGLDHWMFGEACYCSKPRVGSMGGALLRIDTEGVIEWATFKFPGDVFCPKCNARMEPLNAKGFTEMGKWDELRHEFSIEFECEWWKCPQCPTQLTFGNFFDPDEVKKEDE